METEEEEVVYRTGDFCMLDHNLVEILQINVTGSSALATYRIFPSGEEGIGPLDSSWGRPLSPEEAVREMLQDPLTPIMHWYFEDPHLDRPSGKAMVGAVAQAAADLETDRTENIRMRALLKEMANAIAEKWQLDRIERVPIGEDGASKLVERAERILVADRRPNNLRLLPLDKSAGKLRDASKRDGPEALEGLSEDMIMLIRHLSRATNMAQIAGLLADVFEGCAVPAKPQEHPGLPSFDEYGDPDIGTAACPRCGSTYLDSDHAQFPCEMCVGGDGYDRFAARMRAKGFLYCTMELLAEEDEELVGKLVEKGILLEGGAPGDGFRGEDGVDAEELYFPRPHVDTGDEDGNQKIVDRLFAELWPEEGSE